MIRNIITSPTLGLYRGGGVTGFNKVMRGGELSWLN